MPGQSWSQAWISTKTRDERTTKAVQRKKWDTEDAEVSALRGCENKADGSTTHTELLTVICYFQMERKKAMFDARAAKQGSL